jgi:hypothetical protein
MATTTPNYGWPVPTSTDYVKDGATAIEALGDAIDATVFGLPTAGLTLITATTFTASSTINVNSCFTSTYENYRVMISFSNLNASAVTMRYRTATTDNSSATYVSRQWQVSDASAAATRGSNATSIAIDTGNTYGAITLDILSPQKTMRTFSFSNSQAFASSASGIGVTGAGMFDNTTVFDGFSILGSANMTGTLRVYGYKN